MGRRQPGEQLKRSCRFGKTLFEGAAMDGPYLDDLLKSIPIDPGRSDVRYGVEVSIYSTGRFVQHAVMADGYRVTVLSFAISLILSLPLRFRSILI